MARGLNIDRSLRKAICHYAPRPKETFMPFDPVSPLKDMHSKETSELETNGYPESIYPTVIYKSIQLEIIQVLNNS